MLSFEFSDDSVQLSFPHNLLKIRPRSEKADDLAVFKILGKRRELNRREVRLKKSAANFDF